ncbi:Gfo/Idh/MocA family protein [Arthrobacter sp. 92]|uniref:Gfo/Idh/MocA family protein n=1 Tax=Arthrobacter sp. 92 TaxID=3418175 RepID=UPI003D026DD5
MAIHRFDMARFLLDSEPVSVWREEYNPSWSWYRGDAGAIALFEMSAGERFVFTGSWCSPGFETSWNARWRISGEHGTVLSDGDTPGAGRGGRGNRAGRRPRQEKSKVPRASSSPRFAQGRRRLAKCREIS